MYPHGDHLSCLVHSKHPYLWCGCVRDDSRDGCLHDLDHDLGDVLEEEALRGDNLGSGDGVHGMDRSSYTSTSRGSVGYSRCSSSSRTMSSEDSPTMSSRMGLRGSSNRSSMEKRRDQRLRSLHPTSRTSR